MSHQYFEAWIDTLWFDTHSASVPKLGFFLKDMGSRDGPLTYYFADCMLSTIYLIDLKPIEMLLGVSARLKWLILGRVNSGTNKSWGWEARGQNWSETKVIVNLDPPSH